MQTMFCITCGHEISQKTALKHMEKCFQKVRDFSMFHCISLYSITQNSMSYLLCVQFECLSAFGSSFPSRIEGNIFCDKYHAPTGTYCKRLKVLCPEHFKQPKVFISVLHVQSILERWSMVCINCTVVQTSPDEVCGCPLQSKQFRDTGEVCRTAKRKCNKHPCWERMRRAEIDLERLRQVECAVVKLQCMVFHGYC